MENNKAVNIKLKQDESKKKAGHKDPSWILDYILNRFGVFLLALGVFICGSIIFPSFRSAVNIVSILWAMSILGLVASGMGFVTYSGHYADLSVVATIAFSGNIAITALPLGLFPALVIGSAAGVGIGVVNGLVIGRLRANPILWTLAVTIVMEGIQRALWGNMPIYPNLESGTAGAIFVSLFGKNLLGVPIPIIVMIAAYLIAHILMTRTSFGKQITYLGASYEAARLSGINLKRNVLLVFVISAFSSSVAGIFMASMTGMGLYYVGQGYDFRALTAVVIGGVMLEGAKGSMIGAMGGVLVIGVITSLLTFLGMKFFQQAMITGMIFIAVVWLVSSRQARRGNNGS